MRKGPVSSVREPDIRSATRYLRWLGREHKGLVTAGTTWGCLWMFCMAVSPYAIGRAVDAIVAKNTTHLLEWCGAILVFALGVALGSIMRHRCDVVTKLRTTYRTMQLVTRQATRLGASLDQHVATGEVVAVSTTDIQQMGYLADSLARGVSSILTIIAVAILMLVDSVPVGLLVLVGVPLLLFGSGPLLRPLYNRADERRDRQADLTERAVDIVAGLRVLRGVGGEEQFGGRYQKDSEDVRDAGVAVARIDSVLTAAEVLLPGLLALSVVWLGAYYSQRGDISPGTLVTFYAYAAFLSQPMRNVTQFITDIVGARVAAARIVTFLALPAVNTAVQVGPDYAGEIVDAESGLTVRSGTFAAVVTATPEEGAALAERLGGYSPSGVTLDGVRLDALPVGHLRRQVLVSDNEARLFSGTVIDEIGGGADANRVSAALELACAGGIVEAMPGGLDAVLSERGLSVSGGERQRFKIARAVVADPSVLVMVDPASALDSHTEATVAERLYAGRAGRTTIVISTSPPLLNQADEVTFLSNGTVTATGVHSALAAANPDYARVVLREDV